MRALALLVALWSFAAHAQVVPISPIGAQYTVTPPVLVTGNPTPCSPAVNHNQYFLFNTVSGADTHYQITLADGCIGDAATPTYDVTCTSSPCSYGPVAITKALNAVWQVRAFFSGVAGPWSAPTFFSIDYPGVDSFSAAGCSWRYNDLAAGQGKRVIDMNTERGSDKVFPRAQWLPISLAGIVPSGTQAVLMQVQVIQTPVAPPSGIPLFLWKTRPRGSTYDPEPYGGAMYTTAERHRQDDVVILDPSSVSFEFQWNDRANGNGQNGAVTGQAFTGMIKGRCN